VGKVRYGIRTVETKKTTIVKHSSISEQFELSKKFDYQFELSQLSPVAVQQFQLQNPLHAIQVNTNEIYFFSGWHWLPYCYYFEIDNITTIIHKEIDDINISEMAWMYLLSTQMLSFNHSVNLAQATDVLSNMPTSLKKNILLSGYHSSNQRIVEMLADEPRDTIRNQARKGISKFCELQSDSFPPKKYIR
jgi:hypothetical protein